MLNTLSHRQGPSSSRLVAYSDLILRSLQPKISTFVLRTNFSSQITPQTMDQQQRKRPRRHPRPQIDAKSQYSTREFPSAAAQQVSNNTVRASPMDSAAASLDNTNAVPYATLEGKLDPRLLKALNVLGFQYMTPVQQKVLSQLPDFRSDCLVRAKTGTGKTVAFFLPALHSLLNSPAPRRGQVSILVVSPTRELALQIAKECDQLTSQIQPPLECHTAFGGTARAANMKKFMTGSPSILVATPGRLLDYLGEPQPAAKLADIKTLILDEADTMLEQGFLLSIKSILKLLPPKNQAGWQGMCFSATMPDKIKDVLNFVLFPGYTSLSTIDSNEVPTIDKVPQFSVVMPSFPDMFTTLAALLDIESKTNSKIIVFGITANMVSLFAKLFSQHLTDLKVFELHSRLSQPARTRTTADFKAASSGILFASDVVGRGLDFPNVDLVVQVGMPSSSEQYVHRVGRTGRAEKSGRAIILLAQNEAFFLKKNPRLPIHEHPDIATILRGAANNEQSIQTAMSYLDEQTKQKAYSSFLGFFAGSGLLKAFQLSKEGLVAMANDVAIRGMYCPEPPPMEKTTIGKMGLKGVPGINYASPREQQNGSGGRGPRAWGNGAGTGPRPGGRTSGGPPPGRGGRGGGGGGGGARFDAPYAQPGGGDNRQKHNPYF